MGYGWSRKQRLQVEKAFYDYLNNCYVNSKDAGTICLGEQLYDGQRWFITGVFDSLEKDIHKIYVLKSRQLGISTIARALTIFLLGVQKGMKGAIVFDTDSNKKEARSEIATMIKDLPGYLEFPSISENNRDSLTLENDSKVLFMAAGVKKSKGSGTLGRSVGLSLCHLSEICSYDNTEGLEAFEQSLSEVNPNRLYIYESTARGPNIWQEMWEAARADDDHCFCLFLGWWSKPSQMIPRDHADFIKYGTQPPTEREQKKIDAVRDRYNFQITQEQLAWVRRKMDPAAKAEGDSPVEYEGNNIRLQEQPWVEEDSWQVTGAIFFAPEDLTKILHKHASNKFSAWSFYSGLEFIDCKVEKAPNQKSVQLKVWEEPVEASNYVVSCDPAYGENEDNDRSCIQVFRCYADGMDQVAEYAWPLINTNQLAWMFMTLCGWYSSLDSDVYNILELNGPGMAVLKELTSLRAHINNGYQPAEVNQKGLQRVFNNVKSYIYNRPDSLSTGGNSVHWKMSQGSGPSGKIALMERTRDFVANGMLRIRSIDLLKEMEKIVREGDSIAAAGSGKDDRVIATAMAVRCWEDRCRRKLSSMKRTREYEEHRSTMTVHQIANLYQRQQLDRFFADKARARMVNDALARRRAWRGY